MTKKDKNWVFSDPHWHHKNLIKGISNWTDTENCRPFDTMQEYNLAIINGINSVVAPEDTLYCLGDWSFGGIDKIWEFRKQLYCKDIKFTFGNHDKHIIANKGIFIDQEDMHHLSRLELPFHRDYNGRLLIYARNLFSECAYRIDLKLHGTLIVMAHNAHRVWEDSHKGSVMLYGHSHNNLPEYVVEGQGPFRTMDVGLESAFEILGSWRPFHMQDEIMPIMRKRPALKIDRSR